MANPYRDLQNLLARDGRPETGTVVSVESNILQVTTRRGVVSLRREDTDATAYRAGDRVRIVGDTVKGRFTQAAEIYYL